MASVHPANAPTLAESAAEHLAYRQSVGCSYCRAPVTPGHDFCNACLGFDPVAHSDTCEVDAYGPPLNPTSWGSRGDYNFINP